MEILKNKLIILIFFFYLLDVHQFPITQLIAVQFLMRDIFGTNIQKK